MRPGRSVDLNDSVDLVDLVGRLVGSVGWLIRSFVRWLNGWSICRLVGLLVDCLLVDWLVHLCSVDPLVDWLVHLLVGWSTG